MEQMLRALPPKPKSLAICLAITTALVGICFLAVLGLQTYGGALGWYLMYPAIIIPSVLFSRSCGIYGGILSTFLLYLFARPTGALVPSMGVTLGLLVFLILGLGLAFISAGLRAAWERAEAAERTKDLLLQELGHRTKNNLTMAISVLSLQARSKTDPEIRAILEKAIDRIRAIADAHDHFQLMAHNGRVEMRGYLETLCSHLGDSLRDVRPIAVRAEADEVYLRTEHAIPLGLIVNELVTNALKHAFPDGRDGVVTVVLKNEPPSLALIVQDNGIGCPAGKEEHIGSRLMRLFVQQLGATIVWEDARPGCRVRCVLPAPELPRVSLHDVKGPRPREETIPGGMVLEPIQNGPNPNESNFAGFRSWGWCLSCAGTPPEDESPANLPLQGRYTSFRLLHRYL